MRGVLVAAFGGLDAMQLAELPDPAGPGQVLVRVHASGVNFAETRMRAGTYSGVEAPFVLGMESAGTVVGVGPGVDQFERANASSAAPAARTPNWSSSTPRTCFPFPTS